MDETEKLRRVELLKRRGAKAEKNFKAKKVQFARLILLKLLKNNIPFQLGLMNFLIQAHGRLCLKQNQNEMNDDEILAQTLRAEFLELQKQIRTMEQDLASLKD